MTIKATTYCQAKTKTGAACRAYAIGGGAYCYTHDPTKARERAAAHSAGGRARHGRTIGSAGDRRECEPVTLATVADVVRLLESEVNCVLGLEISLSRAQTIARLALAFIKAFEVSELQLRLEALERALKLREDEQPKR